MNQEHERIFREKPQIITQCNLEVFPFAALNFLSSNTELFFFISPPLAWTPKVNGVVQPTHTGFLKFIFGDITLVAWNWPWWENLHHENWHILQIRWVFFVCVCFVLEFIGEPLVKYLPAHHCPKHTYCAISCLFHVLIYCIPSTRKCFIWLMSSLP